MGRKKKVVEGPSGPKGAPDWVVTFTDMISLLVTFFVLLMTFSSLDAHEVLKIHSVLTGKNGPINSKGFMLTEMADNDLISATDARRGAIHAHTRPTEHLTENIEEMGQKQDGRLELDLNEVNDGLVIEFDEQSSFGTGSAQVPSALEQRLVEIGKVLQNYPHMVVVEGFTDAGFRPDAQHASADDLSFARAEAAAGILLARTQVNPALLQITGYGDTQPRADDSSASGRQLNRRIQLRILSLSKVRDTYLKAQERNG